MNKLSLKYKAIKDIKERRKVFLTDIAGFYNSNNRSVGEDGVCKYSAQPNSPGCAIGRCLGPSIAARFDKLGTKGSNSDGSSICDVFNKDYLKNRIPVWMREMGVNFLWECQSLHDKDVYWNKKGLSIEGKRMFNGILEEYCS